MNATPLHPILVHVPIALAAIMPLLTFGLLIAHRRNWLPKRTWGLAVALQAILVGGSVLAIRSGEADEERVERVVPEAAIETHAEAAVVFTWSGGFALGLILLPLLLRKDRPVRIAMFVASSTTVIVLGLGYQTGRAGGELVYRHGAASAFVSSDGTSDQPGRLPAHVDDDDDR